MKKFLLTEIIICAIFTACMPQLWSGGFFGYILYVIATLFVPLLYGYLFAALFLLIVYIIRLFFPIKLPKIHKVAFVIFCIFFVMIAIQDIKEIYFKQDGKEVQNAIEETTKKDNTSDDEKAILSNDIEEMHKYMRGVLNTIVKNTDKEFALRSNKMNIPEPFIDDLIFLVRSKEKLNAAINKQNADIKQYKEDTQKMFDDIMDNNVKFAMSECTKKYKSNLCEGTMKPFKRTLVKIQNKNYEFLHQSIDCLEEELNLMRFIDEHYDKFRVTDKGPYFTDPGLQKYFETKMQDYVEKMLALSGKIDKIKQNSKMAVGNN